MLGGSKHHRFKCVLDDPWPVGGVLGRSEKLKFSHTLKTQTRQLGYERDKHYSTYTFGMLYYVYCVRRSCPTASS